LLQSAGSVNSIDDVEEQWEEAIASRKLTTTWQRETKTMAVYSAPLIVTFFLQYSINVVAVLAVGRIGKMELGAVSCKIKMHFHAAMNHKLTFQQWPT
jgi:MATE family multidrug resistance protein